MASVCFSNLGVVQFSILVGFAAFFLSSAALAADIPELVFLSALLAYYLFSKTYRKVQWYQDAYQRIMHSIASFPSMVLLTIMILCVLLTAAAINGVPEVGFAMCGTIAYFVLHSIGKYQENWQKAARVKCKVSSPTPVAATRVTTQRHTTLAPVVPIEQSEVSTIPAQVTRPEAIGWDTEVREIVRSGLPTAADELTVRQIISHVRKSVVHVVPEAVVVGSAACNLLHIGAQGLKPEVDIIVMASPEVLTQRLKEYFLRVSANGQRHQKSMATLLPDALQKTATRVLSERLSSLRFWRSQFVGPEPKVVLLAPAALGFCQYPIRVNFYVNNPYPQRLSMVLAKGNARCKELVLFVNHWAQIRGITHTAKGHLHSYAYSLLVIYFLREKAEGDLMKKSTYELFGEFICFYGDLFGKSDPVAVRFGVGEEQSLSAESKLFGIPFIEDPFATTQNVASAMTADGVTRLKEELTRASRIVDASPDNLGILLERWVPETNGEEK